MKDFLLIYLTIVCTLVVFWIVFSFLKPKNNEPMKPTNKIVKIKKIIRK